ncbi:Abi family protein [Edwardsiella piscicida]|nr:Abi family protein [Edwardsiella piscicida]
MDSQPQLIPPLDAVAPTVKVFLEYPKLVQLLIERGMNVSDQARCERKLAQVGYYRLSGYWHSARTYDYSTSSRPQRNYHNQFQPNTCFESIFRFYLFDKALRQEFMNAIERIEIYFRTIIAHEMGRISPLAYEDKSLFSANAFDVSKKGPNFADWTARHKKLLEECKEDSIESHFLNRKPIPIWVAMEAWDFGQLSKFYSMLKDEYRDVICARADINNRDVLDNWLININGLRNRCAHHSRFCNRPNPRSFKLLRNGYFNLLNISQVESGKLFGAIAVIWFLLKKIGPSSKWLERIAFLIDEKPEVPGFYFSSMGFSRNASSFPRDRFYNEFMRGQPVTIPLQPNELVEQLENLSGIELANVGESLSERLLQLAAYYEENSSPLLSAETN